MLRIQRLPDGLFKNCPALTRLVLEHTDFPCGIGERPFDGADQVRIFVPYAAYSYYRDGYGCEANPWTPYLDRILTY